MKTSSVRHLPRKVLYMYLFAILFLIAAIFVAQWEISGQHERSDIRHHGQKTTAFAISRKKVQFIAPQGKITTTPIVGPVKGTLQKDNTVVIFYNKKNPKRVVLDQDDAAFNVTMWLVVVKLFGAAAFITGMGYFTQRKVKRAAKNKVKTQAL